MTPDPSVGAGADRVLYVLATLARHDGPLSIAALAEQTGLAQSTLYRQVALLKRWGFVAEHDGEYGPGPLSVQLAWGFDQSSFLIHEAQPDMAALAVASGETIGLLVAVRDQAVCLDMVESQHPLRCSFTKGRGLPLARARRPSPAGLHAGARLQAALGYLAGEAGMDPARLSGELDHTRAGYAVTDSEVDAGVWGVSVPIFQRAHQAVASITLMAPSTRAAQRPQALIDMTVGAARRISLKLQAR